MRVQVEFDLAGLVGGSQAITNDVNSALDACFEWKRLDPVSIRTRWIDCLLGELVHGQMLVQIVVPNAMRCIYALEASPTLIGGILMWSSSFSGSVF